MWRWLSSRRSGGAGVVAGPAKELVRAVEPIVPRPSQALTFGGGLVLLAAGSLAESSKRASASSATSSPSLHRDVAARRKLRRRRASDRRACLAKRALGAPGWCRSASFWRRGLRPLPQPRLEEAVLLVVQATLLLGFRRAFYRRSVLNPFALTWSWLAAVLATVMASIWLGFFAYRHVEYANTMWWTSPWTPMRPLPSRQRRGGRHRRGGGPRCRHPRRTERLHRSSAVRRRSRADRRTSPSSVASLALLGDKRFLFSPDRRGS